MIHSVRDVRLLIKDTKTKAVWIKIASECHGSLDDNFVIISKPAVLSVLAAFDDDQEYQITMNAWDHSINLIGQISLA